MFNRQDLTGGSTTVSDLLAPLLRQFWTIALIVGTGALASLAYSRMQIPQFEASSVIQVRPGVDFSGVEARLTSRRNLLEMAVRHGLNPRNSGHELDRAAVMLRQSIAVHDLTSNAGLTLGFDSDVAGMVVSVVMPDAELSARIANDLAQQILDAGNSGTFASYQDDLSFYRREEERLWQESSAMRAEMLGKLQADPTMAELDGPANQRQLTLLVDQYDLVREKLAEFEVEKRRAVATQAGQYSLLQRASSITAVSVVRNWMLVGVAGSLLLAVALAFVLDRRYPALQRGPWDDLVGLRQRFGWMYRMIDDPARPILGIPRFLVVSLALIGALTGTAALIR